MFLNYSFYLFFIFFENVQLLSISGNSVQTLPLDDILLGNFTLSNYFSGRHNTVKERF